MSQSNNKFDNVCLDLDKEFAKQSGFLSVQQKVSRKSPFLDAFSFLKGIFLALLYKIGILQRFFYANFCLGWLDDFKKFWVEYLGNRNIDIIDFHFLRNSYRSKFQQVSLDHNDEKNKQKFLASWQDPGNVFYLFQSVWQYSKKAYLDCWLFAKFIKKNSHFLEYGCSIAPITQGLLRYFSRKNLKITIADIPQICFLYARWKLRNEKGVKSIIVDPLIDDNLPPKEEYDVIVCLTVFEHLPNPLVVAKSFLNHLKTGGVLIFDYIKADACGLDSVLSAQEREEVLNFIGENFYFKKGKVDFSSSMGLTVAVKK